MKSQCKSRVWMDGRIVPFRKWQPSERPLTAMFLRAILHFLLPLFGSLTALTSASLGQGSAPSAPQRIHWDARSSGLKPTDSVTDQTAALNAAVDKACQLGRPLYLPSGTYNAGLTLDSTNDNLVIIFGDSVRIKQVWHITGNGPDLDPGDPNYNATQTGYVENVTLLGTLTLGSGGRLGTFYCRNVKIENIIGEDSCAAVHIYSHSEDVSIDKIHIKGTKLNSGYTGAVWMDKYPGAVTSFPKNIVIGSIHVDRAHYNGVFIEDCKDVRIGDIRVDTAGLNGLRITGSLCERIAIGSVSVNKCGANTTNNTSEYLHSGISIDGSASRVAIHSAVVRNSWERGLVVTNGVRGLDIGNLVCDSNAINDSAISYSVLIESSTTENISIKRLVIKNARVADSSYGLTVNGAKNVTIGDLAVRNGYRIGCLVTGTSDNITIGSSHFALDSVGVQLGSSRDGHYNFESIMVDSCRSYGLFLTSLTDSSSVSIGSLVAQGDIAEAFRSGVYMSNADGAVYMGRVHIRGYDTTNARGFQVANNNDGKIRIDHMVVENCATGVYWDTVANDGFSFGVIDLKGNTNDYSTGAQRLLADRDIHFGVVDDTGRFGRFPYVNTTPSDNFIWKFDAADSTWKLEADVGAGSGDDVKFDSTTAAGGVVDLTNPVIQEGSNITFSFLGTDTIRIEAAGAVSTKFIKTVDTNSAGTTTIAPDSIHLNEGPGININGQIVAGTDSVTISSTIGANIFDTTLGSPYRDTVFLTTLGGGVDTLIGFRKNGNVTEIFKDVSSGTFFDFMLAVRAGIIDATSSLETPQILPLGGTTTVYGDGVTGHKLYNNSTNPDSAYTTLGVVKRFPDYLTVDTSATGKFRVKPLSLTIAHFDSTQTAFKMRGAIIGSSNLSINGNYTFGKTVGTPGQVMTVMDNGANDTTGWTTISGSGDNVKADTTTGATGPVDLTNPVLQEGKNVTFAIVGSDTLRFDANAVWDTTFRTQNDAVLAGVAGIDCVLSGLAITGGADMTPAVAKGGVLSNRVMFAIAGADVTIGAADANNPRIDLIVVNSSGALAVRAGTASSKPIPPARTANDVVIGLVYVAAGATTIPTTAVTDTRVFPNFPVCIYRTTAAEVTNTTAAAIHLLNKTGSGVTIPSGLFLAGRQLRIRLGGNILTNSGTPTENIVITYGGTTMFADISGTATAGAVRTTWAMDLVINAQANNDQALGGILSMGIIGAKTAPTTGNGDAWSTAQNVGAISGAAAVDSDAANRVVTVEFTFSVSNVANEIVVEYATVELL
jgi:hypothetical protein